MNKSFYGKIDKFCGESMRDIKEILKKSKVFGLLDEDSVTRLAGLFDQWTIHPGDVLTNAGDTAHTFFLLGKGTVLLAMEGGKAIVLDAPGDFMGLELLSAKGIYKTSLSVLEEGSVFAISRQGFMDLIQEDSAMAETIMDAWQDYLETKAPFAKNNEGLSLVQQF